ncbi:hypothetical protein RUESEDTHA_01307 [Ruegeria sp. THAF57]|nr:hypothetical protein RUESEDTHA_01307 [Ruegeria sp. THAF57]
MTIVLMSTRKTMLGSSQKTQLARAFCEAQNPLSGVKKSSKTKSALILPVLVKSSEIHAALGLYPRLERMFFFGHFRHQISIVAQGLRCVSASQKYASLV